MKSLEDDFPDRMMYALKAPIITWPLLESSITEEQVAKAKLYRLAMTAKVEKLEEATEFEAMLYIMTSTLANPPSHTFYKLYMYLFRKFFPETAESIFAGEVIEQPQPYELQDLKRLQQWLFKRQMEHLKEQKPRIRESSKQTTFPLT